MKRARLRPARLGDIPAMMAVKESLRLVPGGERARGGFLLGCPEERYAFMIGHAHVTVLEAEGGVGGFAVALPDRVLRASELWVKRSAIRWRPGLGEPLEVEKIAYFDQLALAPWASRLHAVPLALAAVRALASGGHDHLYATTLAEPVCNAASLPLLRAFGARIVASVPEDYPDVGPVLSWLHHARIEAGLRAVAEHCGGARATLATERMSA